MEAGLDAPCPRSAVALSLKAWTLMPSQTRSSGPQGTLETSCCFAKAHDGAFRLALAPTVTVKSPHNAALMNLLLLPSLSLSLLQLLSAHGTPCQPLVLPALLLDEGGRWLLFHQPDPNHQQRPCHCHRCRRWRCCDGEQELPAKQPHRGQH